MAISPAQTEMKGAYYDLVEHFAMRTLGHEYDCEPEGDPVRRELQTLCARLDRATNSILAEAYCDQLGVPFRETLERDVADRVRRLLLSGGPGSGKTLQAKQLVERIKQSRRS